jgi:hypothetical protein
VNKFFKHSYLKFAVSATADLELLVSCKKTIVTVPNFMLSGV